MDKDIQEIFLKRLACPSCGASLSYEGRQFVCSRDAKHIFPVMRGIPRFVTSDLYVDSFSFEWNTHNRTQLDTFTQDSSSEEQFIRKTGFTKEDLRGKLVLDAGVGAGRYSDVVSRWGANVAGVDLSYAVEASHNNFIDRPNVFIAQADISKLPFLPQSFDFIFSIGVLHHTPDTHRFFQYLVPLLKPGGTISIWVYPNEGEYVTRSKWIPFTSRIPDKMFYAWCKWYVTFFYKHRGSPFLGALDKVFPISKQNLGIENDILDTFDAYSPTFHGIHSPEEVRGWFEEAGLVDISSPSDWHTCMRGKKPA
jgi:SAM-dependent methyltransferase